MTPPAAVDALVVGAGLAGLTAARALAHAGLRGAGGETSGGRGGRAAPRRLFDTRVDHGAQYLTVRDPRFAEQVDAWLRQGVLVPWTRGFPTWRPGVGWRAAPADGHERYVAPEGMSALGKALAAAAPVTREARVTGVGRDADGWTVAVEQGAPRRAPRLLITAPVPQALDLLRDVSLLPSDAAALAAVRYAPCLAMVLHLRGATPPPWPAVRVVDHPDLAWIGHDGSKRSGPRPEGVVLVAHATAAFTRDRADAPPGAAKADLLRAVATIVPWAARPDDTVLHRWRYARAERPHRDPCVHLAPGLVLAGDGFGADAAGRLEGAYLSGLAAAKTLLDVT